MKAGDTLDGRYEIIERLGAGGMGEVFKAVHTYLGAPRVIKVVHPHISSNADARERFLREARAATKVQHNNVATLHDFATLPDGAHYMVWEFIDGVNVAERLRRRGTLAPRQAVRIAIQALRGLDAIHRAGIVHRDISPENLMITAEDEVKIIDLGVAKLQDTDAVSQTRTGIFVGKLRYASPEQLGFLPEGETIDARADLYAMAMVLVELLTGRPPYEAKSPHEYFLLHAREARPTTMSELPAELPGSAALQAVLEKALARDRNERYGSAREMAAALEEIERTLPEPHDAGTVAVPVDADATMRVVSREDTLHRMTQRTPTPVASDRTAETIQTPLPAPAAQATRKGLNPAYVVAIAAVVVLLGAGVMLWPQTEREPILRHAVTTPPPPQAPVRETTTTVATPQPQSAGAVTVSAAPAPAAATATTAAASPPHAATRQAAAKPVEAAAPQPVEAPTPEPQQEAPRRAAAALPKYVDGHDSGFNDRALELLREEVRGTRTLALRAGGMQVALVRELRDHISDLEFVPYADVVVRFDGTFDRLGRGRKRRAAVATVEKNGRVVFQYELPDETYRVGMTPVEAFARVLATGLE